LEFRRVLFRSLCTGGPGGACQVCNTANGICVANTGAACPVATGGGACDASGRCKVKTANPVFVTCGGVCTAESEHTCGPNCNDCYAPPNNPTPHISFAACF